MLFNNTRNQEIERSDRNVKNIDRMGMKILTEIFCSRLRKREGLEDITLTKKQCRLDIRKFSFSQRTVN